MDSPEGSSALRQSALRTGRLYHPPANVPGTHFRWWLSRLQGQSNTVGNRTRDLPARIAVPQPNAPPRAVDLNSTSCTERHAVVGSTFCEWRWMESCSIDSTDTALWRKLYTAGLEKQKTAKFLVLTLHDNLCFNGQSERFTVY